MQIRTYGSPTKVSPAVCRKALRYYGQVLLTKYRYDTVSIKVQFCDDIKSLAYCQWVECTNGSKYYAIHIRENLSRKRMLTGLAHEMVHVMQWTSGVLRDSSRYPDQCTWKGKKFIISDEEYFFTPWEVEAHGLEVGLYQHLKRDLINVHNRRQSRMCERRQTYKRS